MNGKKSTRQPNLIISVLPLIFMMILLLVGYGIFRIKVEVLLIICALFTGMIGRFAGFSWEQMQTGIIQCITKALPAMLIVITVGILISSWMVSGIIPMLIFYGLRLISPEYFLVSSCIVCSVVSILTGTSWGTVGTIGVALIGVAEGLNISLPQAAGAIISGAYFGDKLSPFSDTTNLAPIVAGSNLFDHITHMLWTTLPAWIIGLLIYSGLGIFSTVNENIIQSLAIINAIQSNFNFNVLLLLPLFLILYSAFRKLPTVPSMLTSSLLAIILGFFFQNISLTEILNTLTSGYHSDTGNELLDRLLRRGGMMGMMEVTLIAFCAFGFAGIMQVTGMLDQILNYLTRFTRNVFSLVASTAISCISVALMTGSSFLSIIIPAELFAPQYKKYKLAAKNLSRTTEDSGTVVVPLIPWSMAGIFMSGTLGVATLDYLPWTFMNYLGFFFAISYGYTGFAIDPKIREDETKPGS